MHIVCPTLCKQQYLPRPLFLFYFG